MTPIAGTRAAALLLAVALTAAASRASAQTVCQPGHMSDGANQAEEKRASGDQRMAAARALPDNAPQRQNELQAAEKEFRDAVTATGCVVPLNVVRWGEALDAQGRYVEARAVFQRLIALRPELEKYRIYAKPLRDALAGEAAAAKRVAMVEVVLRAPGCEEPVAIIGGAVVPTGPQPRDPGVFKLEASARGCNGHSSFYEVKEGSTRLIEVNLRPPPPPFIPPPPPVPHEPSWFGRSTLGVPRWLWVSAGGVLVVAGGVVGYQLLSTEDAPREPEGTWGQAWAE